MSEVTTLPRRLPRSREPVRQRGRLLLTTLFVLIALLGVAAVVFVATSAGDAEGAGLSVLYAFVPLPLLWFVYWWLDRYEPEPGRYKFAAFVWGAVVAVAIALATQIAIQHLFDLSDERMATFIAPVTEEPAKGLFLLLTFARLRRVIDGVLDGLIYAGLVGIGFAFMENIGYYAASYLGTPDLVIAGAEGATTTFVVRGLFSPFAHPLFTSAFGIAIGIAVFRKTRWAKFLIGAIGMIVSIGLHMLWNASLSYGEGRGFFLLYLILAVIMLVTALFAIAIRMRQVRILEDALSAVAERGWIHPAEIPYLARFGYRKAARGHAKAVAGKRGYKVVKRYQNLATEMSFLHHSVMTHNNKPHGIERTYALLDAMYELRPYLRFPPALTATHRD